MASMTKTTALKEHSTVSINKKHLLPFLTLWLQILDVSDLAW